MKTTIRFQLIGQNGLSSTALARIKDRIRIYLFDQGVSWSDIDWIANDIVVFESNVDLADAYDYWLRKLNNYIELTGCYLIPDRSNRKRTA